RPARAALPGSVGRTLPPRVLPCCRCPARRSAPAEHLLPPGHCQQCADTATTTPPQESLLYRPIVSWFIAIAHPTRWSTLIDTAARSWCVPGQRPTPEQVGGRV